MTIKCVIMFIFYNLLISNFRNDMDFYQIMNSNAKLDITYLEFVIKYMSFVVSM
jgi:hypothetical protein